MKIALPVNGDNINQHFGKSKEFVIFEIEENNVKKEKTVSAEDLAHNHEGLASLLKNEDVQVAILGGIGPPAKRALEESGIEVVTGAEGPIIEVAELYARGELESRSVSCSHGHGHGCEN